MADDGIRLAGGLARGMEPEVTLREGNQLLRIGVHGGSQLGVGFTDLTLIEAKALRSELPHLIRRLEKRQQEKET